MRYMKNMYVFFAKIWRKLPVLLYDIFAMGFSWYLAYLIRYNFDFNQAVLFSKSYYSSLLIVVAVNIIVYYSFKAYRGLWRFFSINDVISIVKSSIVTLLIALPCLYFSGMVQSVPRTVFFLYFVLVTVFQCSGRLMVRVLSEIKFLSSNTHNHKKRVLVIGAGAAGEGLIRDMKRSVDFTPVGLLDEDKSKKGLALHGVRVLGNVSQVASVAKNLRADLIFIAIPSAGSVQMREILSYCGITNLPTRTLPGLTALADGNVAINAIRDVNIDDLLGRDQVHLDWEKISRFLTNKSIAITGGGGSIGSELCRQIITRKPRKILIIDHSEYNLYKIDQELRLLDNTITIELALISITDKSSVDYYFNDFNPEIVFHAAAYKHVPMLEDQLSVALHNNVIGTKVVAEAAVAVGVEEFILISTDKAVNPTNIMGASKRITEIYCQNLSERVPTKFITVRFGNVLGSTGSVVPLFTQQLKDGGPLTVTHPDIERFFMTIPEACQLILQAMVEGSGGEIFVLDMGQPIKISYLAEQMIRLAGKKPNQDISIVYTGLRPGEKLYEELFHTSEQLVKTDHEKLFKARFRSIEWSKLIAIMQNIQKFCETKQNDELFEIMLHLVPEYKPSINSTIEQLKQ